MDRWCAFLRAETNMRVMLLFFGGLFLVSQVSIAIVVEPVGIGHFLRLQTTLSVDTFAALVVDMYQRGVAEHYLAHYYYDFVHPVWYAMLLALLLGNGMNLNAVPARFNRLLLLPFLAGFFDLIENALHLYMIIDTANIRAALVWIANGAAIGKWVVVSVGVLAILVLYGRWLRRRPAGGPGL